MTITSNDIVTEVNKLKTNLSNAYSAIEAKGGTLPAAQNFDNLATAVSSISTGDEITATNTTGSAVSADDRVWVNGEDVYTRDFTVSGNPLLNDNTRLYQSKDGNYGLIYKSISNIAPTSSFEQVVKIEYTSNLSRYTFVPVLSYDRSAPDAYSDGVYLSTGSTLHWYINNIIGLAASPTLSSLTIGNYYWFKFSITTEGAVTSYSTDGENYTQIESIAQTGLLNNSVFTNNPYFILGSNNVLTMDLSECYIKVDGQTVWTPYTTSTTYSIINDKDITSTSFTGIAQEAIANNATGSIKTLLDGNGTYAPTTATKSITTNGTYTASAENAYGLSEVTVNVPTPDVWYNWKTDVSYTPDFTANSYAVIDSNAKTFLSQWSSSGAAYISKQQSSSISAQESIEFCLKLKFGGTLNNTLYNSWGTFCGDTITNAMGYAYFSWYGTSTPHFNMDTLPSGSISISCLPYNVSQLSSDLSIWYWVKVIITATTTTTYYSLDGNSWTLVATDSSGRLNFASNPYIVLGSGGGPDYSITYDLSECYIKVDNEVVWTPYVAGPYSECYTLSTNPTTSTQVYEIPKKTSALTITAVGTGTITLSDSKVYNRNSAGDVESPVLGTKTITSNDTYTAASDYLDGFSSVTVDVPSAPTKKYNLLDRVKDDSNNEIGTVSGFFTDANDVEYAVVCLDAQYRLDSVQWCSNSSTIVTDLPIYDTTTWGPWEAKETATFNTQKILDFCTAQSATSGACSHCRSKSFTIDGTTYYGQLPNMLELNDIVRNHTALNAADITASSYPSVNFESSSNVWSSSQLSSGSAWVAYPGGSTNYYNKTTNRVAAPVLEIPNT